MRGLPIIWHLFAPILSLSNAAIADSHAQKGNDTFAARCSAIAEDFSYPDATVWFSQHVAAGTNVSLSDNPPSCSRPSQLSAAEVCRVALYVSTTNQSGISMEAWLPSNWTGRFLSTGTGGLSGCMQFEDVDYATSLGFATVATNAGHNGTSGRPFYDNEDIIRDFAYRSVHTGVVVGKAITKQFYEKPHDKSYYLGCSTGGRQGLRSAQSYPEDFDGIVAGAPAIAFNNLSAAQGNFYQITGPPTADTFVPLNLWSAVHEDVLKQCDQLDGAADGILEDTLKCKYDPSGLLCGAGSNMTACLTAKQVQTVKSIYSPLLDQNGELIYPRAEPGGEGQGSAAISYTGQPFQFAAEWYAYAVYKDLDFDATHLTVEDYNNGYLKNPGDTQSFDGDLSGTKDGGSKVLHYHGSSDPLISSEISPLYYKHVQTTMGLSAVQMDDFYRFFRIGSLGHCRGGNGPWQIGQSGGVTTLDADKNVLLAMVKWVEEGKAPETVTGVSEDGATVRRHCRWPYSNKFVGQDVANPDDWECQEP